MVFNPYKAVLWVVESIDKYFNCMEDSLRIQD